MIDLCGYKFQVGQQTIHLYPIAAGIWDMQATSVMIRRGQIVPNDPRVVTMQIDHPNTTIDPDSFGDGIKCFASESVTTSAIVEGSKQDFLGFAKKYGGIAFKSLAYDGSWIIKGTAKKMEDELGAI